MSHSTLAVTEDAKHLPFGQILLTLGKLTPQERDRILQLQVKRGKRFGEIACSLGLISTTDVEEVLTHQLGYRYLQPYDTSVAPELVCANDPDSPEAEAIRAIRSHLEHRWFAGENKSLAIASVGPGEGTSIFAANLAIAFSQTKRRTVLLDANLCRPRQQSLFGLKTDNGLAQALNEGISAEIICAVSELAELSIVPTGKAESSQRALVATPMFATLQESLVAHFERVLIDCPSFSDGADAYDLASQAGGVLLVVRKDGTNLTHLTKVTQQLRDLGIQVVGSVLVKH
jgi:protein-tyrosine kinase